MRVLICGSRDWTDAGEMRAHMLATVERYPDTEFIVGYDPERDYPGGCRSLPDGKLFAECGNPRIFARPIPAK
jgi:hypothetical protein